MSLDCSDQNIAASSSEARNERALAEKTPKQAHFRNFKWCRGPGLNRRQQSAFRARARACQEIYDTFGTFTRVSDETGVSIQTVKRYLFLLQLAPSIQERLTTNDGPAGLCTLSKLAELFQDSEEQEYVLKQIEGFTRQVQIEILKRSNGNIDKIDELRAQALGGCFNLIICKGLERCPYVPQECLEYVKRIISAKPQPIKVGNLKGEVLFG
jgi:hypothetical protein